MQEAVEQRSCVIAGSVEQLPFAKAGAAVEERRC
jgi:hypothetical protein